MAEHQEKHSRLVEAYNRMLERFKEAMHAVESTSEDALSIKLDYAKEKAHELGELSREEAERIGDYLRRDIEDAANYLSRTGQGIADWLKFDLQFAEDKLAELFANAVDTTRLEWQQLQERAEQGDWFTGDITGPGILRCKKCHHQVRFETTRYIPPCPKCLGTVFTKEYGQAREE